MPSANDSLDSAIRDLDRLRKKLKGGVQVRSLYDLSLIKATCLAWFNNYRADLVAPIGADALTKIDALWKAILSATDRATSVKKYEAWFKNLRSELSQLRGQAVGPARLSVATADAPPNFDALVPDPAMRAILTRRWKECTICVTTGAPLAATVMMGGLLESLLLARVHRESDKSKVLHAKSAPKDVKTGKPLMLQEWTLRHYIDVAHELGWISAAARDVGEVVRDYRNYVHPHKELTHEVSLSDHDAFLFWGVSKGISRQLLEAPIP